MLTQSFIHLSLGLTCQHQFLETVFCVLVIVIKMEQRTNIKFCLKLGKSTTKMYEMIKCEYGEDAVSFSRMLCGQVWGGSHQ